MGEKERRRGGEERRGGGEEGRRGGGEEGSLRTLITDGGLGGFTRNFDTTFPIVNGTANHDSLFMFAYQAHHELTLIGKQFTKNVFGMGDDKLYAYYQRYADERGGAITGAPAMRFAHQQIQLMYSNMVEKTLGYYPPPCELEKFMNLTIAACDPMDGKIDGVIARTDLCKLNFNLKCTIGEPYYCAAVAASTGKSSSPAIPAQDGTVSAQAVAVAAKILDGLHDSQGRCATWELPVSELGSVFPVRFIELLDSSVFDAGAFGNVTYDTLGGWMYTGWQLHEDALQTMWPDITPFHVVGGRVLQFHGEADNRIPTASFAH
ncbi:hypothetical protein EAF04_003724 [Stromatinia cepivora]|nr:hypothetical protein EAF04_003724 [Stromatinia cepivora]